MNRAGRSLGISLRALGGRLGGQWERERRDTLFLLGAVLLTAAPQLPYLPLWIGATFAMLFSWRLGLVLSGRWLPRTSVRVVAAIACTAGILAQYQSLIGREPGIAMLVLFLGLKLMEVRARRDLFVVIFLCFFLMLTGFFHSQTIWFAAATLAAVLALVATMVTMQFGLQEAPIARRFRTAATILAQAIPIAALTFVLFPRLETPLWGSAGAESAGRTGISDTMTPGAIARLSQSAEIAFRVKFDGDPPSRRDLYWRGPVLGEFDGVTWRESAGRRATRPRIDAGAPARRYAYTTTLEPHDERWLFMLETPVAVAPPHDHATRLSADYTATATEAVTTRVRFRATSDLGARIGASESPEDLRRWLALPPGFNPGTLALAQAWRAQGLSGVAAVDRALLMFREEPFRYTLRPPLLGRDSVDEFLFRTRAGFCEHFSAAFVVLMRALEIPARVVTGYQGGEPNPRDDYWIVRQSDAHAWAEIWIGGAWRRVDPTSAVAPERVERGARLAFGDERSAAGRAGAVLDALRMRLDSLTNAWNQWVLSYDGRRQRALLERLGLGFGSWEQLAGLLAAGLMILVGAFAVVTLHPRSPRDPVERCWSEFCDRMAAAGLGRERHETAWQFMERAARYLGPDETRSARTIVAHFNALRYGPQPPSAQRVRHLRQCVRRFKP